MKRKVLITSLAIAGIATIAFAFAMRSKSSNASTSNSAINWVIDNQMTPFATGEIWLPGTGTPPTTAQNAIDVAVRSVGGAGNIHSPIRVRYVLVSEPWENGLKNHPMWAVEMDNITWTFRDTEKLKTVASKAEILIDANTGKNWGGHIGQISAGDPTPTP